MIENVVCQMGGHFVLVKLIQAVFFYVLQQGEGHFMTNNVTLCAFQNIKFLAESIFVGCHPLHYSEVIMGAMASQITSLTIVYSTVYSGAE